MRRLLPLLVLTAALALPAPASAQITVECFAPSATPCSDVWHTHDVTIQWTIDAPFTPVVGCVNQTITSEAAGAAYGCTAETPSNDEATRKVTIRLDKTAPTVIGAAASRPPDHNGWYRRPVGVTFSGSDALSGLQGCSSTTYSSANAGPVNLLGRCQDKAGNVSAPTAFALRYDATPPDLTKARTLAMDDAVRLRWKIPGAAAVRVVRMRPGGGQRRLLKGGPKGSLLDRRVRNGHRYTYTLTATDPAGNTARKTMTVVPGPRLLAPATGARLPDPPKLRWTRVRGADYYNVQLFRGRHKILSAWPTRAHLQLRGSWRYGGEHHRLAAGRKIRWFVWPGHGSRALSDYGPLVGSRTFTLRAP